MPPDETVHLVLPNTHRLLLRTEHDINLLPTGNEAVHNSHAEAVVELLLASDVQDLL